VTESAEQIYGGVQPIIRIGPQPGQQEKYLSSDADIAIYGGAAGAGKTWATLLEPLRHVTNNPEFACVIFRRNMPQIKNPGGLWDESMKLYPLCGGVPVSSISEWNWPEGGKLKFAHLDHESTKLDWQGSQIPLIGFDELTHFTESQFFYMVSRNRSMCGVRPYIRATCNPDADSWVARLLEWWIDQKTGFPIPERSGVVRWFIRLNDALMWGDSKRELIEKYGIPGLPDDDPLQVMPKSLTFVPGKLSDNQALMKADPGYLANLKSLPLVEQARLLGGNWKIRAAAGLYFKREWVKVVDALPVELDVVRYWDLAATEKTDSNDPDWTVGVKMGKDRNNGRIYVMGRAKDRASPFNVRTMISNTAEADTPNVRIGIPQDPGQAGKSEAQDIIRSMGKFNVRARRESGDKIMRFGAFSAQCQAGNVYVLRGSWNEDYFTTLEAFPSMAHDDDVDASSGAYAMLTENEQGLLDYYRQQAEEMKAATVEQAAKPSGGGLMDFYKNS
jgi:predicted phage terminase large subunit-like protein